MSGRWNIAISKGMYSLNYSYPAENNLVGYMICIEKK